MTPVVIRLAELAAIGGGKARPQGVANAVDSPPHAHPAEAHGNQQLGPVRIANGALGFAW